MSRNQSDIAYDYLREMLLTRELVPGTRVRYGPIGLQIGMSATPVREAIGRLASEGLVELVPQTGAVVKQPSRSEVTQLYELRDAIESYATAKAAEKITDDQLKQLDGTLQTMREVFLSVPRRRTIVREQIKVFDRADLCFHEVILEAGQNNRMMKAVKDYHLLTAIIGTDRHSYHSSVLEQTIKDHFAIYHALQQRNAEQARQAASKHIRHSLLLTLANLHPEKRV